MICVCGAVELHCSMLTDDTIIFYRLFPTIYFYDLTFPQETCNNNKVPFTNRSELFLCVLCFSLPSNASYYCFLGLRMWLLWFLLPSLLSAVSGGTDSKAVTTTLTTKWADTPLLLEARYNTAPLSSTVAATSHYALPLTLNFSSR